MFMVIRQVPRICHVLVSIMEKDASVMVPAGLKRVKKSSPGVYRSSIACEDCCRCIQLLMEISQLVERNFSCLISIDGACLYCGKNRLSFRAVQPVVSTLTRELKRQSRLESRRKCGYI